MSMATLELKPGLGGVKKTIVLGCSGFDTLMIGTARPKDTSAVIAMLLKAAMSTGAPPRLGAMDEERTGASGFVISTAVTLRCTSASSTAGNRRRTRRTSPPGNRPRNRGEPGVEISTT